MNFLELMRMSIFGAMPQTFAVALFAISFIKKQPAKWIQRFIWFAVLHSFYTDVMQLFLPLAFHLVNSWLAQAVLLWLLFKDLNIRQKIAALILMNFTFLSLDLIGFAIAKYWMGIVDREEVIGSQFWRYFPIVFIQSLLLIAASRFTRMGLQGLKHNLALLISSGRSKLGLLIMLIFVQFYLLGILQAVQHDNESSKPITNAIIIYAVIAISLAAIVLVAQLIIRTREHAVRATQDHYIEDINRMFASIRGQRHDFINHLQVIHTMTQMNKTKELQSYVAELVHETQEMSEIVNHASPALAAFVKAKTTVAIAKGITFMFELPQQKSIQESSIRTIDIIKILGNLVENAFDEVSSLPTSRRVVRGSIRYENQQMVMEVANSGRILNSEERKKIFAAGFTTKKGGKHSGLGLAIVSERTEHYGGKLELLSDEENGTVFRITIPQQEAAAG